MAQRSTEQYEAKIDQNQQMAEKLRGEYDKLKSTIKVKTDDLK